jgi:aminopeptidase
MPDSKKLRELARLAVKIGVNVQHGQPVIIRASVENQELVQLVAEEAYIAGASKVIPLWNDDVLSKLSFEYRDIESLKEVPEYIKVQYQYFIDQGACLISVASPNPDILKDVDSKKMQASSIASSQALSFFREHTMGNKTQWSIIGASNPAWAKKVFPELDEEEGVEALWDLIFKASRIEEGSDTVETWLSHNARLGAHDTWLNGQNFKSLVFKNSLGTHVEVGLIKDHRWVGGGETGANGVYFNPNIPTEENFTMPDPKRVEGKVVASKPLSYQGKIVENFWFEFKEGKVVNYDAEKGKDALTNLLETDEGSTRLGEIALVEHDSPISQMNRILFNTLYDENASCHMALGRAYPMNIKDGLKQSLETLLERGYNNSLSHVDFMFGTRDLSITGITYDNKEVLFFEGGKYIY